MRMAIIPARGGSKRIPRKNIKLFCGKPMIAWSIESALESGCFDEVVVSTDDDEIAQIAVNYGASTPFKRPHTLSGDHVATRPVVNHAIEYFRERAEVSDVCCLYATAPFISSEDLQKAYRQLRESKKGFVFSAAEYVYPVQRAFVLNESGEPERLWKQHQLTRSQDLPSAYHDAGQFYWGTADAFLSGRDSVSPGSGIYRLPAERVVDIDTPEDWRRAELLFELINGSL